MEWLLKIVEGSMKGAEIALVEGVAVSFGSGDECDIIVQDATVPAKACEFEVAADGVRITVGGGSAEPLPPFEVRSFGTTSLAVGPVDGEWQNLIKPVCPAIERADPDAAEATSVRVADEGGTQLPSAPQGVDAEGGKAVIPSKSSYWVPFVFLLLLLAVAVVLAWFLWPKIAERYPKAEEIRLTCVDYFRSARDPRAQKPAPNAPTISLADLAKQHGLVLTNNSPSFIQYPLLRGNLKRRTERLAIRAMALAVDPAVKFDLTDDETLFASAAELVFACSDGALKVDAAANRVVTMSGYAPSRQALEKAVRALNADVKGIDRLDTSRVRVGGTAPAAVAKTPFVREEPPGEHPVVAIPAHTPNPPMSKTEKTRDYPIAGILTAPYSCVVMRNGVRLVEGAQIGKAVLVKIEANKLTLNDGGTVVEWKP